MAISTPRPAGEAAHGFHGIARRRRAMISSSAPSGRGAIELRLAPAHRDHPAAVQLGQLDEHQADGPQPDDRHRVARPRQGLFQAAHHAGQRLHQRGVLIAHVRRNRISVPLDDARRNANVLGVRAVVEQQVLAQVLAAPAAIETLARRGRNSPPPRAAPTENSGHALAHGDHIAGQLVPEHSRGHDHPSVVSAAEDLHVGAAGQRHLDPNEDVPAADCGNGHRLHLQVFFAVEHGRHHLAIHYDHLCG